MLATLAVLLQTRSVTGTARRLGLSQPTVSRSLAELRHILDDPLLVRTSGGMQRTRRAEGLVGPVEEWLASTSALLHAPSFAPDTLERCFRIASTDYGVLTVIAPALAAITAEAPAVTIDIVPFSPDMMQKLASGEIDLVVSGLPTERDTVPSRALFSDTFRCIMRQGHALAGRDAPLPLDDFFAWPHIGVVVGDMAVDGVEHRLGSRSAERRITARLPYFHAAPALLAGSDALMTLPSRAATRFADSHGLAIRPAPEIIAPLDYRLLWHPRSARDQATQWLADLLASHCA
ncbi:LysR family transcriptional regulator [Sphingomonas sp. SORGH_AS_0879]|uniref:LysR family transcriptional regulator n=1 Tax=Sphingomonas sp. SORGH_AS_0879 TaxID=3041790 RepID=UPI00278323E3|nr:LysR family transcriptional regulator [Sphingomonas sp. SORGH_AS_0879]MDQ1231607.1 DNA-binding transcriptional LysR family regulator [Sphingomonas sp. SORGH_AS_0879]